MSSNEQGTPRDNGMVMAQGGLTSTRRLNRGPVQVRGGGASNLKEGRS